MGQKVFIFSLIFVMVVVLFTGCGKKTTPDPLEGTWQFKEQVYKVKGLPVEEESYKFPHKIYPEKYKDKNVYLMEERYYQFRNNIRTTILHLSIAGDLTDEIKDVIKSE
jgi:hypothetical protein